MIVAPWLRGLLAHRRSRLLGTAAGVAVAVALLASIGTFLSATTSKMTGRAAARVPVDWQVEVQAPGKPARVLDQVSHHAGVQRAMPVQFGATPGLQARAGGTTQKTGPGRVLGLPAGYDRAFPGELRSLAGSGSGVLLAQQTAANLHAQPGDSVRIALPGGSSAPVKVDGVVDLPAADSLFQKVGAPVGAQPQAPPDNVILLPASTFQRLYGSSATTQIHAALTRDLPGSPSTAPGTPKNRKSSPATASGSPCPADRRRL
jgi:putative ABC transport system permease protein